jgi:hypothetical protein
VSHATRQHPNGRSRPGHRRARVPCLLDRGWTVERTAERFPGRQKSRARMPRAATAKKTNTAMPAVGPYRW